MPLDLTRNVCQRKYVQQYPLQQDIAMRRSLLNTGHNLRMSWVAGIALLFLACTGAAIKSPYNLPEDATSYLTNCSRLVIKSSSSYWKNTGIEIVEGDMILFLGSELEVLCGLSATILWLKLKIARKQCHLLRITKPTVMAISGRHGPGC